MDDEPDTTPSAELPSLDIEALVTPAKLDEPMGLTWWAIIVIAAALALYLFGR